MLYIFLNYYHNYFKDGFPIQFFCLVSDIEGFKKKLLTIPSLLMVDVFFLAQICCFDYAYEWANWKWLNSLSMKRQMWTLLIIRIAQYVNILVSRVDIFLFFQICANCYMVLWTTNPSNINHEKTFWDYIQLLLLLYML
jgi:hypothetical protein